MTQRELKLGERPGAPGAPPIPVPNVDVRRLPLDPQEAFVWSRVDGRAALQEIAWSTGLEIPVVERALHKLASVGAIRWPAARTNTPSSPASNPPRPPPPQARSAAPASLGSSREPPEPRGLSAERAAYVQALYRGIQRAELDHYQLLGVSRDASKQQIKSAYFQLVADVHPDRYFGEELGELRLLLTTVFEHLTKAHDTLTRSRQRAEYDAYLSARDAASRTGAPRAASSPAASNRVNATDETEPVTTKGAAEPVTTNANVSANAKE